jgi:hypothetical protein
VYHRLWLTHHVDRAADIPALYDIFTLCVMTAVAKAIEVARFSSGPVQNTKQ